METKDRRARPCTLLLLAASAALSAGCLATTSGPPGSHPRVEVAEMTRGMQRSSGLFDLFLDPPSGRIYLLLPAADARGVNAECLYVEGLTSGLGSNPVGLDRGQIGRTRVVRMRTVGTKVLVEEENLAFRAESADAAERAAAEESFARSVLWAGTVLARDHDGRVLVDLTTFLVSDAHGIAGRMRATGQGIWNLDPDRSVVDFSACLVFPDNIEFEALLTYTSAEPGPEVLATAPTPSAVSFVQHHSFVRLPDDDYRPREHDPRSGSLAIAFSDYASGIGEPLRKSLTVRHRLAKIDPTAAHSRVKEPIVYYVDRAAPEPIRSALVEGASWWAEAFEAAGFEDAFRVELLPEGVHPLDVRYNVIQWVHRATRGWSYGGGVVDPRTGEMIKGHVTLGSLRVRHDRLLFEGLEGAEKTGSGANDDPVELALARIRQLAAHEVGHTLGFEHNFAASTYLGRASVMDYPAPLVRVRNGALDFSQAYAVGIGAWDVQAVRYAYSEFPPGTDEHRALDEILRHARAMGLRYLSDEDARPAGASNPRGNLWDNGSDPIDELAEVRAVRRFALEHFGSHAIALGRPLAELQEVLGPVYFHHRYQLEAVLKIIGGLVYEHAAHGDGEHSAELVAASEQERALDAVLDFLDPEELDLPDAVLALLLPRPPGEARNREMFASQTEPAFDALGAAASAAELVVAGLLQPERMTRLVDFHRRDETLPSLESVLDRLIDRAFRESATESAREAEIRRTVQDVVVSDLLRAAEDARAPERVKSRLAGRLEMLAERLRSRIAASEPDGPHALHLSREIERFAERPWPASALPPQAGEAPPGMPIGSLMDELLDEECAWSAAREGFAQ
jgi:hypothetical protein